MQLSDPYFCIGNRLIGRCLRAVVAIAGKAMVHGLPKCFILSS